MFFLRIALFVPSIFLLASCGSEMGDNLNPVAASSGGDNDGTVDGGDTVKTLLAPLQGLPAHCQVSPGTVVEAPAPSPLGSWEPATLFEHAGNFEQRGSIFASTWAIVAHVDGERVLLVNNLSGDGSSRIRRPGAPALEEWQHSDLACAAQLHLDGGEDRDLLCYDQHGGIAIVWGEDGTQNKLPTPPVGEEYVGTCSFFGRPGSPHTDIACTGWNSTGFTLSNNGQREFEIGFTFDEGEMGFYTAPTTAHPPYGTQNLVCHNEGSHGHNNCVTIDGAPCDVSWLDPSCDTLNGRHFDAGLLDPYRVQLLEVGIDVSEYPREILEEFGGQMGVDITSIPYGSLGTAEKGEGPLGADMTSPMGFGGGHVGSHEAGTWFRCLGNTGGAPPDYCVFYEETSSTWRHIEGGWLDRQLTSTGAPAESWAIMPITDGSLNTLIAVAGGEQGGSETSFLMNDDPPLLSMMLDAFDAFELYPGLVGDHRVALHRWKGTEGDLFEEVAAGAGLGGIWGNWSTISPLWWDGAQHLVFGGFSQHPAAVRLTEPGGNFLRLELAGTASNRNGLGAVVRVFDADDTLLWMFIHGEQATQVRLGNAPPGGEIFVGVGQTDTAKVEVDWPSGQLDTYNATASPSPETLVLIEGSDGPTPVAPR